MVHFDRKELENEKIDRFSPETKSLKAYLNFVKITKKPLYQEFMKLMREVENAK
jgi:preprotein translocase subunit Sss1